MKRVIVAVILISVAVSTSVWSYFTFNIRLNELKVSLDGLINCAEVCSDSVLSEKVKETTEVWNSSSPLLHSLVMHEGMDDLEEDITALSLIIEHSTREEFKNKCIEALNQIENLLNSEKPNIENIL